MPAAVPAVEVLSAEKTYPDGTRALLSVELTLAEGEFVTLLGPSGCGKSTLLQAVGLLEGGFEGGISIDGVAAESLD